MPSNRLEETLNSLVFERKPFARVKMIFRVRESDWLNGMLEADWLSHQIK